MAVAKAERVTELTIPRIEQRSARLNVVGTSPLILNRMSRKAEGDLLVGGRKKNAAEKQATLKHNPLAEFRASPYVLGEEAPTLLGFMASGFKGAMCTAALDLPGTKKAQIGRLVYVVGDYVAVYGKPYLLMSVVRSADINRTPDIRTRVIVPRWACQIDVRYVTSLLSAQAITNLLAAAGVTCGVGDWRPEKGKGSYGQFEVVNDEDPELRELVAVGRSAQVAAMEAAEPYDAESHELLAYWRDEIARRGFDENGRRIGDDSVVEDDEAELVAAEE